MLSAKDVPKPWIQLPASAAACVEVVCVTADRGSNVPGDEVRTVYQYWSKDGRLLAEYDTLLHSPDVAVFEVMRLRRLLAQSQSAPAATEGIAAMDRLADLAAIEAGLVMPITRVAGVTGVRAACAHVDVLEMPKLKTEIRRVRAAEFRAMALALEAGGGIVAVLRAQALRCKAAVLDMGGWAC